MARPKGARLPWARMSRCPPPSTTAAPTVAAVVRLPALDIDAWSQVLDTLKAARTPAPAPASGCNWTLAACAWPSASWAPGGAQLAYSHNRWHGQLQAEQFAGDVEYHRPSEQHPAGLVFARLERLEIPASDVEKLELEPQTAPTNSGNWPALDIRVENFTLADKRLGQLSLLARQRQPGSWSLERLQLTTPETRWQAHRHLGQEDRRPPVPKPRRTRIDFTFDTQNAGQLLDRLGMPGVVRDGRGQLSGQLSWQGSPAAPHWPSMAGSVRLGMDKGQFLKADPGMGRLLSVLSLQSISRRLSLDFRDVFSAGFAFDFVRGDIDIAQGIARTDNLQMKGLNAAVLMEGQASLQDETQQLRLVVVPRSTP